MLHKTSLYTLAIIFSITLGHSAMAQVIGTAEARIDGDVIQTNAADGADVNTLLGSARIDDPSPEKLRTTAIVGGDVAIENEKSAVDSRLDTLVGAVSTGAPVDDMRAEAFVGKDLLVRNSGRDATVKTEIGSSANMSGSTDTSAIIDGSVKHTNSGTKANSSLLIGSLEGNRSNAPR